jgi:hypothetical protein
MKKQQNAGGIASWSDRVFSRHTHGVDRDKRHVVGYGPNRTYIIEALSTLGPSDRSWLGTQQCTDSVDFALSHRLRGLFLTKIDS